MGSLAAPSPCPGITEIEIPEEAARLAGARADAWRPHRVPAAWHGKPTKPVGVASASNRPSSDWASDASLTGASARRSL